MPDVEGRHPIDSRLSHDRDNVLELSSIPPVLSTGSRTVNVVPPGALSTATVPPCASTTAATMASPRPVLPAAREREPSPRANRSKTSRQQLGRDAGSVVGHGQDGTRAPRCVRPTMTVVPGGVCVRALASRLASTWCSRAASPTTVDRLVRQVQLPAVVRARRVGVADRVDDQPGQVHRLAVERPARVQAGQQQQVLDQRRSSARSPTRPGPARARRRAAGPRAAAGSARRSRGSRPAGCAARGWRRRRTGAPGSRWPAGRPAPRRRGRASG